MNTIRKFLLIGQQSMEDDFGHYQNDQLLLDGVNHQMIDEEPYQMIDEDPDQEILDEELHHQPDTVDEEPNQHIVDSLPLESVTTHSNDTRNEDMADEVICQKFLLEGCGCSDKCYKKFSESYLLQRRYELAELSREELDLVVMGQLMAYIHFQSTTIGNRAQRVRSRMYSTFYHGGERICKGTFLFLHNMGEGKLKRIKSSFLNNGLKSRYKTLVVNYYYYYLTEQMPWKYWKSSKACSDR